MNRRSALKLFGLAPVAGAMAARDASHEIFIGEHVGEPVLRFRPIKVRPADLEYLESRRFAVEDIARSFSIPPALIGRRA
jgi:hypothetical protein